MRVGVDGCKKGWFCVQFDNEEPTFRVVEKLSLLIDSLPDDSVVLVDKPIGLREEQGDGARLCDIEARKILVPKRSSSVVAAPCRQAVYASSYEEGSILNKRILDKKLSKQSWASAPKLREVDQLLHGSDRAPSMVREVHREVCFWGLNSDVATQFNKKTREGFNERLALLSLHHQ
jgi:predicted RNase H-like nuclease